jgi:hypothetical protein
VRLVLADERIRLVAYAPRVSLQQVATHGTWLAAAPDRAPDSNPGAGVRVAPGIALEEKERRGSLRRVAGEAMEVRFEGWLEGEGVGPVFVPERFAATPGAGLVASGTVVTAPNGDVVARFADRAGTAPMFVHEVTPLPGAPEGFQAIRFRSPAVEVRGLVPVAAYRKNTPGLSLWGVGYGSAGGVSDSQHAVLRAGAGLFDAAGDRVGVALSATEVWVGYGELWKGERRVWAQFLFSQLGFVHAEVRSADLKPYRD